MMGVLAGHDPLDAGSIQEPVPDYAATVTQGIRGLRLGVDRDYFFYSYVTDDVRTAAEAALDRLHSLGAEIVEVRLPELEYAPAAGMVVLLADTSQWHRRLLRNQGAKYVPATRVMLELGEMVLGAQYVHAQRARAALRERLRDSFAMYRLDCLVGPTLPVTTMPVEKLAVDLTGDGETALSAFLHHTFLGNVVGIPALSFPCGFSSSHLPVGFQVYGRPFEESTLLRVAYAYEQVTDWHTRRPEPQRQASPVG